MLRKAEPSPALAEMLAQSGELDRILDGRGLTYTSTPAPPAPPPQTWFIPRPDWDEEARERLAAEQELERAAARQDPRRGAGTARARRRARLPGPRPAEAEVAPMTIVVVGVIADKLGFTEQWVSVPVNHPGRSFDAKHVFASTPSTEYRSVQAPEILVDVNHDRPIGQVKHLELSPAGKLYAVCEIDAAGLEPGPWFYSPEILHRNGRDIELRAVAIVKKPASVALGPIEAFPGTLHEAAREVVYQDGFPGAIVKRADQADRTRKRGEPHVVHGATAPSAPALAPVRPAGRIEYRSAGHINVNPGARLIELLAVPYNIDATVNVQGRTIQESFSNTAFANIDKQPARIIATRDHDPTRLIGRVVHLELFHPEGLVTTIKASDTPLGRESVELDATRYSTRASGSRSQTPPVRYGRAATVAAS